MNRQRVEVDRQSLHPGQQKGAQAMKVNDVYRNAADIFPAPADSWQRLCIIRRIDKDTVTFSIAADEQPKLSSGIVVFNESTFTMAKTNFIEFFLPASAEET